ncbi:RelA/SpoT domain-containing protein [Deinococcus frigens]|uniref:RelA/SpoT domain-containing protein n=1 Tax=Deinococcus frigens TaxID=249403 RepID=UPI000A0676C9|nr:RelA/SpoT domain-containing protein [Deinococcus frigens]
MIEIVNAFVLSYKREYDYYYAAAKYCAERIEADLKGIGVRAIVTYRAKSIDSLTKKLVNRDQRLDYQSREDVYSDIVDLSGIRIAIYFPQDENLVTAYLENDYQIVDKKSFPSEQSSSESSRRFPGYVAEHYRIKLLPESTGSAAARYCETLIEIQIASVLMHGWSEVEHDIIYKPQDAKVTEQEARILDQINGMVIACEMALDNLKFTIDQRLNQKRRPFSNSYELASFVLEHVRHRAIDKFAVPVISNLDFLFEILTIDEMNTPESLGKLLRTVGFTGRSNLVGEQIIEYWLAENPTRAEVMINAMPGENSLVMSYEEVARNLGDFFRAYALLLSIIKQYSDQKLSKNKQKIYKIMNQSRLQALGLNNESIEGIIVYVRPLALTLMSGKYIIKVNELERTMIELDKLISQTQRPCTFSAGVWEATKVAVILRG